MERSFDEYRNDPQNDATQNDARQTVLKCGEITDKSKSCAASDTSKSGRIWGGSLATPRPAEHLPPKFSLQAKEMSGNRRALPDVDLAKVLRSRFFRATLTTNAQERERLLVRHSGLGV